MLAVFALHAVAFGWYVADDAGISLAYARNIAAGYGPVLYPGAPAVEGYSNPLWVALLAIASLLRLDAGDGIPLLKILGLAFGAGTIALTVSLSREAYPGERSAWVAPVILAVWTPFVFWSGGGLENALYAFLLTLAAYLQLREVEGSPGAWSAAALLGVAVTRPEGVAFFLPFLIHRLAAGRWNVRRDVVWAAVFATGFAVFLAVRWWVFGAWLPNTYGAKASDRHLGRAVTYLLDADDPGRVYLTRFMAAWWPLLLVATAGLLLRSRSRANLLFAGLIAGTAAFVVFVGGDFWPAGRFFTAALPFVAIAAQHAITTLAARSRHASWAVGVAVLAAVSLVSVSTSRDLRRRHHEDTLISLQGRLARGHEVQRIARTLGIEDPLYMDPDIGGPTLAGLRVLDLGGLTDIHIAKFQWYPPFFRQYVFEEQRPHFIRTHATWTRTSQVTAFPEFAAQYVPLREYRDERGRHGLFVRRDLVSGPPQRSVAAPRPAFLDGIRRARAVRAREAQREREGWIEWYGDRGMHDALRRAFRRHEAAGNLPKERARLLALYYGLLAAGDGPSAKRIAAAAGHTPLAAATFFDGANPILSVTDVRLFTRPPNPTSWLAVYMTPLDRLPSGSSLWLHLYRAGTQERLTRDQPLDRRLAGLPLHTPTAVELPLYVPPGDYDLRAGIWRPRDQSGLCTDPAGTTCYLMLGIHPVGR